MDARPPGHGRTPPGRRAPQSGGDEVFSIDVRSHPWYGRDHHRADGRFRNFWEGDDQQPSAVRAMLWFLGTLFRGKVNRVPPVRPIDRELLRTQPASLELTWLGHSTILSRTQGATLLFDPMFGGRASPLSFAGPKREPELPATVEDLPPIDVVVLSHDHYDHLDRGTIESLVRLHDPLFLVPLGVGKYVLRWGASRVVELDWWQYVKHEGSTYHCVPARHFSGRTHFDRDETLWAGWYLDLDHGETRMFYAGDTGYASHFREIRERLGVPKVAVLPIGAYLPPWLMQPIHTNPEEALKALEDLGSDHMVPIHWGTFDLSDEPIHEPAERLSRAAAAGSHSGRVHLLEIGETFQLPSPSNAAD